MDLQTTIPEPNRHKPYLHDLALRNSEGSRFLPFNEWQHISRARKFLQATSPAPRFPTPTTPSDALSLPAGTHQWKAVERLIAIPQARSVIHRLLLQNVPRKTTNNGGCCNTDETAAHLVGACAYSSSFRAQYMPKWTTLGKAIAPVIRHEVAKSLASLPQPSPPLPVILPAPLPLPSLAPDQWLVLPLLEWRAFAHPSIAKNSRTARDFCTLWQVASSYMINLQWLARNDRTYKNDQWSACRFEAAFITQMDKYGLALVSCSSQLFYMFKHIMLTPSAPSNPPHAQQAEDVSPSSRLPP
ncbi:hypothetical protein IWW38_001002 [Coemansia aciculifera]|uniref:Uncharacterized protein n=1 Tax=Coemansia aciculifera TaxID=417176 RepID=A0ACC1M7J8_9FUNG|nr:hypothetical protein IWW38_001002 [Coemansia aciculifera]